MRPESPLRSTAQSSGQFSLLEMKLAAWRELHTLPRFVCGSKFVRERMAKTRAGPL
jgi:hypothetical protein